MNAEDPFEAPKLLIEGAWESINDLESRCFSFIKECRAIPVIQLDRKTGDKLYKFRVDQKIPGRLRVVASDAVNNLRHALDQAVNAASFELGSTKRNNYFPFAKNASELDRQIRDRCPTVPSEIIVLIKAFQPYGGGDDLLYVLSRMSGPNKHQLVLKLNVDITSVIVNSSPEKPATYLGPCSFGMEWDSANQEVTLVTVHPGGDFKYDGEVHMPFFISLGEGEITRREPASTLLNTFASKVEGIVGAIEAETRRLIELRAFSSTRSA